MKLHEAFAQKTYRRRTVDRDQLVKQVTDFLLDKAEEELIELNQTDYADDPLSVELGGIRDHARMMVKHMSVTDLFPEIYEELSK